MTATLTTAPAPDRFDRFDTTPIGRDDDDEVTQTAPAPSASSSGSSTLRRATAARLRSLAEGLDPSRPVRTRPTAAPLVRLGGRWWERDELVGGQPWSHRCARLRMRQRAGESVRMSMARRSSLTFFGAFLLALVLVLAVAGSAVAGGDEGQAPPSAGPPGPWDGREVGEGEDAPYKATDARRCRVGTTRSAGPGSVVGVWVVGTPCRNGKRVVRRYQRCLNSERGRNGRCYRRAQRRCARETFLGRCWLRDRIYRRTVIGYRCSEGRLYEVDGVYEGRVICRKGRRRVSHGYTLLSKAPVAVDTESELRAAWGNPRVTAIDVTADIFLRACEVGDPMRESPRPALLDGHGHTLRQTCFEKRLLRQDGTGFVELRNVTLTRGGSDGPGGAVTTRGEIAVVDSRIKQNLAEEPGGGVMSQRRATIVRSVITGNLANDDGGGVYARRGGIQVYDSILSGNLVDGSGGALGSTGDILVVRSHLDGNTTDGDGGAIYADEDGDVTVIDSTVSGSTADGPGGAIFTLDGDVTVVNSTLTGNRADDRGGAISGEASVTVINSTISRNLAVAHVGGGIWSRGDMYVANSTVSDNYAEAKGGGLHAAGVLTLVSSTVADNTASVGPNIGVGERLEAFGSVIGPANVGATGGDARPAGTNCDAPVATSLGFNVVSDASCGLRAATDVVGVESRLEPLRNFGGPAETRPPQMLSPALDRVPTAACVHPPLPAQLEGEQHLAGLVDVRALLQTDERGTPRPQGPACDAGAVEVTK